MKNSKFVKLILVILIGAMLLSIATKVFAADDGYEFDLNALTGNGTNTSATNTPTTNTPATNTANGTNETGLNTSSLRNNTSTPTATTNTSNTYGNTNLPSSGLADYSLPIVALIVIFGISAAYAYKKVQDYKGL